MADLADLAQQIAYYQAGGKPQGGRDIDKANNILGTVNKGITDYQGIIKNALEAKKLKLENQQKANSLKPITETLVTPQVNSQLSQAQNAPIPVEDLVSGHLDTMQSGIDKAHQTALAGQAKYGAMTPDEYAKISASGLRDLQGLQIQDKLNQQDVYVSSKDGSASLTPDAEHTLKVPAVEAYKQGIKFGLQNNKNQQSNLAPEALEQYAQLTAAKGGELPANLGFAGPVRIQIMNRAAEIMDANGQTGQSNVLRQQALKAGQSELSNLQKQRGVIDAFAKTATTNLQNYVDASNQILQSGVPWANKPIQWLEANITADPKIASYLALHHVATTEASRVLQGNMAGVLSDTEKANVNSILNPTYTPEQTKAAADALLKDIGNRQSSYQQQIAETKSGLFDTTTGIKTPQSQNPSQNGDTIKVISPDGKTTGTIPKSQLQEALKNGYRLR